MKNLRITFCTIITDNYLPYAYSLLESLRKFNSNIHFNILLANVTKTGQKISCRVDEHTFYHFANPICNKGVGKKIFDKYNAVNLDAFRWSIKPVFLNYLISEKNYEKVIYIDCDIYFFKDYMFLFEELDNCDILLTPHWHSRDPIKHTINFKLLFKNGLYNAGFIAINKNAVKAMDWWAGVCLFSCAKGEFEGQFDDQAYLNLLPVYFDNVKILKHQGCNVAAWNRNECQRVLQPDGSVLINNRYPIIFIHFSINVSQLSDSLLNGYHDQYLEGLRKFSSTLYEKEIELINLKNQKKPKNLSFKVLLYRALKKILPITYLKSFVIHKIK